MPIAFGKRPAPASGPGCMSSNENTLASGPLNEALPRVKGDTPGLVTTRVLKAWVPRPTAMSPIVVPGSGFASATG